MARDDPNPALEDGRRGFACVSANGTATRQVTVEDADLIGVRLAFGAESTERVNRDVLSG